MGAKVCEVMRMSDERPLPTPEGRVLQAALKRSGLSAREAALRANISEGRWRQIVAGYLTPSAGVYVEVKDAPADTVARMAKAVGASPEAFEKANRPDVADAMRRDAADEPADDESDLETYVGQTPLEKAILKILRDDRKARDLAEKDLQRQLRELNDKVDRLSSHGDPENGDNGEPDERQLGA